MNNLLVMAVLWYCLRASQYSLAVLNFRTCVLFKNLRVIIQLSLLLGRLSSSSLLPHQFDFLFWIQLLAIHSSTEVVRFYIRILIPNSNAHLYIYNWIPFIFLRFQINRLPNVKHVEIIVTRVDPTNVKQLLF